MIRQFIAGGLYGDHLPSGAWCVLVPHVHCVTHLGIVPFPEGETYGPLFVRCTDVGGFRFAGQAHDTLNPAAYEHEGASWRPVPPPCFGVSPIVYDLNGTLCCSNGSVGSQGYRYVNAQNNLISGDATYGPFHGLFEYTYLEDGLWIGQGAEDNSGIRVWDGVTLRQLEPGNCRFLRATRVGEDVALAFARPEGVVLMHTTMTELRRLPATVIQKEPGPINTEEDPPPEDPPEKEHMESKALPSDVHAIVAAIHAANPVLANGTDDQRREMQQKICETVRARKGERWGWKSNHGIGIANAKDAIAQLPEDALFMFNQRQPLYIWDLFNGGTRKPNPMPVMSGPEDENLQFFVPVQPIDHLAGSVPTEPPPVTPPVVPPVIPPVIPPAPPVDLGPVYLAINDLATEVAALRAAVAAVATPTYRVVGQTSRTFGHAHAIDVRLEKA